MTTCTVEKEVWHAPLHCLASDVLSKAKQHNIITSLQASHRSEHNHFKLPFLCQTQIICWGNY